MHLKSQGEVTSDRLDGSGGPLWYGVQSEDGYFGTRWAWSRTTWERLQGLDDLLFKSGGKSGAGVESRRRSGLGVLKRYICKTWSQGLDCFPALLIFYSTYGTSDAGNPLLIQGSITGLGPPSTENVFVLASQYLSQRARMSLSRHLLMWDLTAFRVSRHCVHPPLVELAKIQRGSIKLAPEI